MFILFEEGLRQIAFEFDMVSNNSFPTPIAAGIPNSAQRIDI